MKARLILHNLNTPADPPEPLTEEVRRVECPVTSGPAWRLWKTLHYSPCSLISDRQPGPGLKTESVRLTTNPAAKPHIYTGSERSRTPMGIM